MTHLGVGALTALAFGQVAQPFAIFQCPIRVIG